MTYTLTMILAETVAFDGCLLWPRPNKSDGYSPTVRVAGKRQALHRGIYELVFGPIPEGLEIDHLCRRRACLNPVHLEAVTTKVNLLRGEGACARNARKTHCKRGHPLSGENVVIVPKGRHCRACIRIHRRAQDVRRRAACPLKVVKVRPVHIPQRFPNHCPKGHEYTPENTFRTKGGSRQCRVCKRRWRPLSKARPSSQHRRAKKLTVEQVREIRELYKPRDLEVGGAALAERFGVTPTCINYIVNRKQWGWVA